jgi:hypothetical protein
VAERLPLIVLARGAYSSGDAYRCDLGCMGGARLRRALPVSAPRFGVARRRARDGRTPLLAWRLGVMTALLARLPEALRSVPDGERVLRRIDTANIAAAGHSFGGLVHASNPRRCHVFSTRRRARRVRVRDARVRAVLVLSGAGPFPPTLRNEDFANLQVPAFRFRSAPTDLAQAPGLTRANSGANCILSAAPGRKYRLTLRGADHYVGGSVGRDDLPRAARASRRYLRLYATWSGKFLDAVLRERPRRRRRARCAVPRRVTVRELAPLATFERR